MAGRFNHQDTKTPRWKGNPFSNPSRRPTDAITVKQPKPEWHVAQVSFMPWCLGGFSVLFLDNKWHVE
jgi:hypothetical protein